MSAGTVKFVCVYRSNGRHLCKAMETHSGCHINGSTETQKHRTLDVDWLINCTSGKTTLQPPWDEDNGFAVVCDSTKVRLTRHRHPLLYIKHILKLIKDQLFSVSSTISLLAGWISSWRIIRLLILRKLFILKSISIICNLWFEPRKGNVLTMGLQT